MGVSYKGFWSYVHQDDETEDGRISKLAKDVVAQYEMITGDTIELFLDKDGGLEWGDSWREKIDDSLDSVAFFIPVMTPRYFMSPECRSELNHFVRRAEKSGLKGLLLPLYYLDIPSLDDESGKDDLLRMIRQFQRQDWRTLKHKEVTSEAYRQGVFDIAKHLVEVNKQAEKTGVDEAAPEMDRVTGEEEDDTPGTIDRMAVAEEELPNWANTITDIAEQINIIGEAMQKATADLLNKGGGRSGFAHKLLVARSLTMELSSPTDTISTLTNQFVSQLHDVDDGTRAIIEQALVEIKEEPDSKEDLCNFFAAIRNLSKQTHDGLSGAKQMIDGFAPMEKMSRDLRPVLRRLRQALTAMIEGGKVTEIWTSMIEASGVDCREFENGIE